MSILASALAKQWITLNDTTIPIMSIQSIEMTEEGGEYYFMVHCTNQKILRVNLCGTGGKWLYMACHEGLEEAKRGGMQYDRL
jgi:hypothetical protein